MRMSEKRGDLTNGSIAALCVHMNSWAILAANIGHLVDQGISDFFVMSHDTPLDKSNELIQALNGKANIRFFRKTSKPFYQGVMTGFLLDRARDESFEIALVFDADEFFDLSHDATFSSLASAIRGEIVDVDHIVVGWSNYVPHFESEQFTWDTMRLLRRDKEPRQTTIVELNLGVLKARVYLAGLDKVIFRIARAAPAGLPIETGNHYASGKGRASSSIVIRHVPVSSFSHMVSRYSKHKNLEGLNLPKFSSHHTRGYASISPEDWTQEFLTKWSWGAPNGNLVAVDETDLTFQRIATRGEKSLGPSVLEKMNAETVSLASTGILEVGDLIDSRYAQLQASNKRLRASLPRRALRILQRLRLSISR